MSPRSEPPAPLLGGDALTAFLAFGELLNFTHAAERLHVSQPALHARIKKLGESLDLTLYRREGRRLVLTRGGEELLRFARELADRTQELHDTLHGREAHAPVTLAAGEGSFLYLLGEPIRRFVRAKHPPLRLLTRDRESLLVALRSAEAQLGVTALEVIPEGLETTLLCTTPQMLVLPSRHPLAARAHVALEDLASARMIVAPRGRPHRERFAAAMRSRGLSWEPAVEVHGWPAMVHCVRLGLGLAIVNGAVKLPRGLLGRPLSELAQTRYFLLRAPHLSAGATQLAAWICEELAPQ